MREAVKDLCARVGISIGHLYIWLDILGIPQQHRKLMDLAVKSLYTYATQADFVVCVAPTSSHANTKTFANIESHKERVCYGATPGTLSCSRIGSDLCEFRTFT